MSEAPAAPTEPPDDLRRSTRCSTPNIRRTWSPSISARLFKRWKSLGLIAELAGSTAVRQRVRLWSRLLAVVALHWVMLSTVWGDARSSFAKAWKTIQGRAELLARALDDPARLGYESGRLGDTLKTTAKQNQREKASTLELLNDPARLDYSRNRCLWDTWRTTSGGWTTRGIGVSGYRSAARRWGARSSRSTGGSRGRRSSGSRGASWWSYSSAPRT